MTKQKLAIGVDIGGTKISMVVGNEKGKIIAHRVIPTLTGSRTRECIRNLVRSLKQLKQEVPRSRGRIVGIGVGIPGGVNTKTGTVPFSPHLKGWKGIPIRKILSRELRLPVALTNDANAAALGEKFFGQGRGHESFVCVTVGTGIGGGLIVHGKLVEGAGFMGGEVGHMAIVTEGDKCGCSRRGCLEAYASGSAMVHYARSKMKHRRPNHRFRKKIKEEGFSAQTLSKLARSGDGFAIHIFERAGFFLGIGIANLLNVLNPEKVILGGGVMKTAPSEFLQAMQRGCRSHAWPEAMRSAKIVPSKLKGRIGDLGTLALAFEMQKVVSDKL